MLYVGAIVGMFALSTLLIWLVRKWHMAQLAQAGSDGSRSNTANGTVAAGDVTTNGSGRASEDDQEGEE